MGGSWSRMALFLATLLCALHCRLVSSQTGCVDISQGGSIFTVEGGVQTCFRCGDGASATWTLDSVLISPSDGTVTNGVLTIFDPATVVPSVTRLTQLFCEAGSRQYLVFLRLRDLQPPNIDSLSVTTVDERDNLTLTCHHLNSNPVTQFYWRTPNGSIINGTVNLASMFQFTDILRSSSGNYTCTVQDDRNNTASSTVTIIVQLPPNAPMNVMVGSPGTSTLGVSWTNGNNGNSPITGVMITFSARNDSGSQNFSGDASLQFATIMNLMPFRMYTVSVFVVNAVGHSEPRNDTGTTLSLRLGAPTLATVEALTSRIIRLNWQAPAVDSDTTADIQSWTIEYEIVGDMSSRMTQAVNDAAARSVNLTMLERGTTYRVRLAGMNVRGLGAWSPYMEVATPVDPPTMPQGLTVVNATAYTLSVTWRAPADNGGGAIVNYRLEIREVGGGGPFVELDRVTGVFRIITNSSQFTISENTTYEIQVTAFNGVVFGDSSTAVGTTQPIVPPDAPMNVMVGFPGTNSLSVSWTNGDNRNSPITGVTITFSARNDSGSQNFPGDASLQSATLMNLMPFRMYTVSVFVVNAVGRSEPRNNTGTTLSLRLEAPTLITMEALTSRIIGLIWQAPAVDSDTTADIQSWTIEYEIVGDMSSRTIQTVNDAAARSFNLTMLERGTTYRVQLAGMNVRGLGAWTPYMEVATPVDPPTMPQGLTVVNATAYTLRVTWRAPADNGGRQIVNYKLEIREVGRGGPFVELDRVTGVSQTITNSSQFTISENTTYEIRVTAFNGVVLGDSSTVAGTTQPIAPTMPQGLTVDNDGAYALRVTWRAPADNGGRQIVNYRLEIREVGRGGPFVELDRVTGVSQTITNSSQFIISENTTYEIQVTAFNGVIFGDSSTALGTTQPIGPPRPLSTAPTTTNLTNTSVDVSWQFPGGYVDFYNIQYKLSNVEWTSPDSVRDINVMGFQTSVSINGLLPNTMYDLRIRTQNANGQSEWSPEATFMTQPPPPMVHIDGPATITAGQTVVLICTVSRDVMVTWSRDDGHPLPNIPAGNVLRIEMPQAEDGGVYWCSAGGVVAMFNLVVVEPPTTARRFQKHKNPAVLPDKTMTNLHDNIAYDQGTTVVSLRGYVAYEGNNHEQDPADDHQYEKLDESIT